MEQLYEIYPTMESFLKQYPIMTDYICNCNSLGEQIRHLNIVIIGIRNMLGWKNENNVYTTDKDCMLISQDTPLYNEINKYQNKPVLKLLLKSVVQILSLIMEETFSSPTLIIDDPMQYDVDIEKINKSIRLMAQE